ncbi:MAG: M24 family metallopeptidase [Hyphomicrobiaceae bacterium]
MPPPFEATEYENRQQQARNALAGLGMDAMVIGDPANINWLTGFDAWSFYTPQILIIGPEIGPVWIGREMDAGAAAFTTYLKPDQIVPFAEELVQQDAAHPAQFMAQWMQQAGLDGETIGYESDVYYFSPALLAHLQTGLPNSAWLDADLLINWLRVVKSPAELEFLGQAATIAGCAMQTAYDGVRPGMRQCDLMAEVVAAQIRGTPDFGGDMTALHPLVLAGEAATTAHPMWTDAPFEADQTVAFELGGCRRRYNAGLARTVHLGRPPDKLVETAKAVEEGMEAVIDVLQSGVTGESTHAAWQNVLDRYGLEKKSRIGYSIGVGYAPDWGEHTISLRPGDTTPIPENAVLHVILGMWMSDWGMELSETIHVRENDAVCLTNFPRNVFAKSQF